MGAEGVHAICSNHQFAVNASDIQATRHHVSWLLS